MNQYFRKFIIVHWYISKQKINFDNICENTLYNYKPWVKENISFQKTNEKLIR